MSNDDKLYDVRVVNRYIKEGMITQKNYESFMKKLPDVEEKSEILKIEEEEVVEETADTENSSEGLESGEGTEIE